MLFKKIEAIEKAYKTSIGKVIIEIIEKKRYASNENPEISMNNYGAFAWVKESCQCVYNTMIVEKVAVMDSKTLMLNKKFEVKLYVSSII